MKALKYITISAAALIVVVFAAMAALNFVNPADQNRISDFSSFEQLSNGESQTVNVKVVGGSYVFEPSTMQVGVPVRLIADMNTFKGCSRSIVIPEFKVSKTVSQGDNVILFTPDKTGTFTMACSMNMYRGTFKVVGSGTGSSSVQLNANAGSQPAPETLPLQQQAGASCGMAGGCGCGMR